MKLGSHNTLTYLKPNKWYLRILNFMSKCQSKDYIEQYNKGSRCFDIRIKTTDNINDNVIISHGLMTYDLSENFIDDMFKFFNEKSTINDKIYIRIIYEMGKKDTSASAKKKELIFSMKCDEYQKNYPNLYFWGGYRKYDWKQIHNFNTQEPEHIQMVSSMTWKIWDDWCPYIYAKLMNKKNWNKYKDIEPNKFIMMDFI